MEHWPADSLGRGVSGIVKKPRPVTMRNQGAPIFPGSQQGMRDNDTNHLVSLKAIPTHVQSQHPGGQLIFTSTSFALVDFKGKPLRGYEREVRKKTRPSSGSPSCHRWPFGKLDGPGKREQNPSKPVPSTFNHLKRTPMLPTARFQKKHTEPRGATHRRQVIVLGVDSPFFSTTVLFKNRIWFLWVFDGFLKRFGSMERIMIRVRPICRMYISLFASGEGEGTPRTVPRDQTRSRPGASCAVSCGAWCINGKDSSSNRSSLWICAWRSRCPEGLFSQIGVGEDGTDTVSPGPIILPSSKSPPGQV